MLLKKMLSELPSIRELDYLGAASLVSAKDFILAQGGDFIAEFPTAITIGIALPHAIVDLLPRRSERAVQVSYRLHAYDVINQRLDQTSSQIASLLQRRGYKAFPIPAAERIDDKKLCGSFTHKLGANLCGFGWIGKSCLLITLRHGPRVRWSTILTDIPAESESDRVPDRCGTCRKCVDICPVHAFTGRHFQPSESRECRFNAQACNQYFQEMESRGELKVCGMCLYACPFGKRTNRSKRSSFGAKAQLA